MKIRKIIKNGFFLLAMILPLAACVIQAKSEEEEETVSVESIYFVSAVFENSSESFDGVNAPALTVSTNTVFTLTAKVTPDNASDKGIVWNSAQPNIASVNGSGNTVEVTAKSPGTAVITIIAEGETADGGIATRALTLTVSHIPVQSVEFGPPVIAGNPVNMYPDDSLPLTAIVKPDNASNKNVTWNSSDPDIVGINGSGNTIEVTAKAPGSATITVITIGKNEGGHSETAILNINVSAPTGETEVSGITLNKTTLTFTQGDAGDSLTATVSPDEAVDKTLEWGSSSTAIATVTSTGDNTAIVMPVAPGVATVTVRSAVKNTVYAICTVTVNEIGVSTVTLDKSELSFKVGDAGQTLTATVKPDNAANKTLQWISGNPAIATVASTGANTALVTPTGAGTVTITVKSIANNDADAVCSVTVTPIIAPSGWIGSDDRLKVDANGFLHNRLGQEVILRGTNLGGWTMQESWMCPVYGDGLPWAALNTRNALEARFTSQQVQTLFDTYESNWITEDDFNWLQNQGVNFVRISFWYRNFMSDDNGTWINNDNGSNLVTTNPGFQRLDWAFAQAAKRGIYVCLLMHGAVGGQSTAQSSGTMGKNELYTNSAYEEHSVNLWKAIATRYKDEPVLAVYDILGEPNNNSDRFNDSHIYDTANTWQAGSQRSIYETVRMYDRFYREIRAIDQDIIIDMEAIWWPWVLPDPNHVDTRTLTPSQINSLGTTADNNWPNNEAFIAGNQQWAGKKTKWENVMYSMHLYDKTTGDIDVQVSRLIKARTDWKVAILVGEFFNHDQKEYGFTKYNANKINWATWTYKVAGFNNGDWSLHQAVNRERLNPATSPYNNILASWGQTLRTFQQGTQNYTPGFEGLGMITVFKAGIDHTVSGVWTKSTAVGFPVGGALGPISAAEAAK